jgi:tRNA nucleotidyltransferase (CCA-adding enzyme)
VQRRVKPSPADREALKEAAVSIISEIDLLARDSNQEVKGILVGSAARDTWLAGDHDLDIFLAVPENGDLEKAMAIARQVATDYEEKYAEHPYVHARINGFEVDLVPCYRLQDASCLKSAVDRTPFHTKYIAARISGLEDEVLLLKQFMKGVGVYGSELKVGGFSGYLTELLILRYRSFLGTLEAACGWRPEETIDLEGRGKVFSEEPLIVIDPVDPGRNVAAALTLDKMFQFVAAARCFLKDPHLEYFFPNKPSPLSDRELLQAIDERGSQMVLVEFEAPAVVEDVLFPQLRKAEGAVKALLERNDFSLLRSDVDAIGKRALMLFELESWELSSVYKRRGPPVWEEAHMARFLTSHPDPISGPYIEDGRAVLELSRKYTRACDLLAEELPRLSLGKHLAPAVRSGYKIYVGPELAGIPGNELRLFLTSYLKARLRMG